MIKLSIKDRLQLGSLFPQQSDILIQTIVRDLRKKVDFTAEELEKSKVKKTEDGGLSWKAEDNFEIEVELSSAELEFLKDRVSELNKSKKVSQDNLELCLKLREVSE